MRLISLRDAASNTAAVSLRSDATKTRLPSGVNFSRFAVATFAFTVSITFFAAKSTIEIVPSPALAAQISLPSGDTSNPSAPRPTAITVSLQSGWGDGGGSPGRTCGVGEGAPPTGAPPRPAGIGS